MLPDPQGRTEFIISRIIGLPNDVVEVKDGKVYVNDSEFIQTYVEDVTAPNSKTLLNADQYYLIGDNRLKSRDSRLFGPVLRDQIDGNGRTGGKVEKYEGGKLINLNQ